MNIRHASQQAIWPYRRDYHVLTYAENGFSPLDIHTRRGAVSRNQLSEFAARVNTTDEAGSLHPVAAVSAVPATVIRGLQDPDALRIHIEEFLRANAKIIKASKVLFDFRTPRVLPFVIAAIHQAALCAEAACIEEIVIVDDL